MFFHNYLSCRSLLRQREENFAQANSPMQSCADDVHDIYVITTSITFERNTIRHHQAFFNLILISEQLLPRRDDKDFEIKVFKTKNPENHFSGFRATDEARTRGLHLGKVALYQLSYYRIYSFVTWLSLKDMYYYTIAGLQCQFISFNFFKSNYSSKLCKIVCKLYVNTFLSFCLLQSLLNC